MTYIKKLIIKGFKSFARETTINLDKNVVTIVGPNGSGKSNITDALCFVLGRLSIKSMRASKASHLIFSGNKYFKGANQAYVEIIFDNSNKTFSLDEKEIQIRRIVRKNGQSIYKINNQTKTRQEVLELLSQAGIDPHGFNIVLQGEIEKFVKMPSEERRKIIEEVAGISIYEMRKQKSLKELDKTNEKLRQINIILRERTNYLKNLENEREQALRFQKLQETVKRCKASIINKSFQEQNKQLTEILKKINLENREIEKKSEQINKIQKEIVFLNEKTNEISKIIQKSSGLEQDAILKEISELKQDIAGMTAKKENFENQLVELDRRKQHLQESIKTEEKEIKNMIKEKGKDKKKELLEKQLKLEELSELKRKYFLIKSNFLSINNQIEDKKRQIQTLKNESNFILNQIENTEKEIKIKEGLDTHKQELIKLKFSIEKNKKEIFEKEKYLLEKEKLLTIQKQTIKKAIEIKKQIFELDICPLCKTKMTKEHIKEAVNKSDLEIFNSEKIIKDCEIKIKNTKINLNDLKNAVFKKNSEINIRQIDIIKIQLIADKKQNLKRNYNQTKIYERELKDLELKKKDIERKISQTKISEEQYETLQLEVNELQRTEERNLGAEISHKQRELERIKLAIKQIIRDRDDILDELKYINEDLEKKEDITGEKEEQAEILKKKYQKMFEEKNKIQDKIRMFESDLLKKQSEKRFSENNVNELKIKKAQINAKTDSLKQELDEFKEVIFLNIPLEKLKQRLNNSEDILARIGNVNLKALEVYENIKEEYDKIKQKVEKLVEEKEQILKIISQIDRKKKKTFIQTLKEINELFSRNFSQLSTKGIVILEPQDKKEIFNSGIDILVKVGGGKRFDVTSLSGGEQTLVALSLIFSIQEYRPYCFYVFDEIDAALDRRNSEKLAYLLKKHMKNGQYLIITHNDSIISESSNVLYGVSMQEGISKILSIEI